MSYLIDTSVLVDFFRGRSTPASDLFHRILEEEIPFALPIVCYQELLQGCRDEKEYRLLQEYLDTQTLLYPDHETFEMAARIFFEARRKGITLRSSIDAQIAAMALQHKLVLLHNDRDFRHLAAHFPLRVAP